MDFLGGSVEDCAPNAEGPGLIPSQRTRSHMPQPRPNAAK